LWGGVGGGWGVGGGGGGGVGGGGGGGGGGWLWGGGSWFCFALVGVLVLGVGLGASSQWGRSPVASLATPTTGGSNRCVDTPVRGTSSLATEANYKQKKASLWTEVESPLQEDRMDTRMPCWGGLLSSLRREKSDQKKGR